MPTSEAPLQFAAPPREVGVMLAARLLLGSALSQIGWLIVGFSSVFFWAFVWNADLSGWKFRPGETARVTGVALDCRQTRLSEGGSRNRRGTPIYETRYRYEVDGHPFAGSSFATGYCYDGNVRVEYLEARPEISRIVGTRRKPFGPYVVTVGVLPAIGLTLILAGIVSGLRQRRLLRDGLPAAARLKEKVPLNMTSQGRTVYRLIFEFTAQNGGNGRVTARSSRYERLEKNKDLTILYDPDDPGRAILVSALPGSITTDETGQPVTRKAAVFLILPALTFLGNGLYIYFGQLA